MRRPGLSVVTLLLGVVLVGVPTPATAVAASTLDGADTAAERRLGAALPRRPGATRLLLTFDRGGAWRDGDRIRVAPRRFSGVVRTDGTRLKRGRGVRGRAARFPCLTCGRAIVQLPDRPALDPRRKVFAFGAAVRITQRQGRGSMNVLQKGWHDEPGGQYKLQVDRGRPSCVVHGSRARVHVQADVDVADRGWHRLVCRREGSTVRLLVDGVERARADVATGRIANGAPVWIGGKDLGTGDADQFRGRMDDVFVRIRR